MVVIALYDLARTNASTEAPDLIGRGPRIKGGEARTDRIGKVVDRGIALSTPGDWRDANQGTLQVLGTSGMTAGTILGAFTLQSYMSSYFFFWASVPGTTAVR